MKNKIKLNIINKEGKDIEIILSNKSEVENEHDNYMNLLQEAFKGLES